MSALLRYEYLLKLSWTRITSKISSVPLQKSSIIFLIENIPENIQSEIYNEMTARSARDHKVTVRQCKPYKKNMDSDVQLGHVVVTCSPDTQIYKWFDDTGILRRSSSDGI